MTSHYDTSRNTVGKIYRDLHLNVSPAPLLIGDLNNEMTKDLVTDLNEAIKADPYDGKNFYIMIHEKKDLQMKDAFLRRVIHLPRRPYPEDDTTVFYHDKKNHRTYFCWCLPHWSEMDNILHNHQHYDPDFVHNIRCWKKVDLTPFGFTTTKDGKPFPDPRHQDKLISAQ